MRSRGFDEGVVSRVATCVAPVFLGVALLAGASGCDRGGDTSAPATEPPPANDPDAGAATPSDASGDSAGDDAGDSTEASTGDATPREPVAETTGAAAAASADEAGAEEPPPASKQPAPLPKVIHAKTNAACGKGVGVGQSLRDFDLPLIGADGKRLSKRSLRGKVSLVNLWGTWCEPCKKELPEFARLYRHYRANGLSFVAIATDDDPTPVEEFAKSRKIAGRLAYDGESYSKTYGERSFPFTFVVDRKGTIVAAYDGYKEECIGQLEADLRSALEAGQ